MRRVVAVAVVAGEERRREDAGERARQPRSRSSSGERRRWRGGATGGIAATRVVPAARSSASRSAATSSAAEREPVLGLLGEAAGEDVVELAAAGSGFEAEAGGIGALTCAIASAVEDSRSNGRLPVRSSKATTAERVEVARGRRRARRAPAPGAR